MLISSGEHMANWESFVVDLIDAHGCGQGDCGVSVVLVVVVLEPDNGLARLVLIVDTQHVSGLHPGGGSGN